MNIQKNTPDVSVVVPVYNVEKYVEKCLMSLLAQDCGCSYEIVVVDDGSKDSSSEIVKRIAEGSDIIRVIRQPNAGLSAARNKGLSYALGRYVVFVDSDDYVEPNYISALYRAAEDNGAQIACCNYRRVNDEGTVNVGCFLKHRRGVFSSELMLGDLLEDITVRSYVWNKIYMRSLFTDNNIEFPVGMTFEDVSVMPKLFRRAEKIAVIKDELYNYVSHKGSITGSIKSSSVEDYVRAYGEIRRFLEEENIYHDYEHIFKGLGRKTSATVFVMLLRSKSGEPELDVSAVYGRLSRYLKFYSGRGYYALRPELLGKARYITKRKQI